MGSSSVTGANGDVAVTIADRVYVWSVPIRNGSRITAGQECASLLPEGAAVVIQALIPAPFLTELRPGQTATLEVVNQIHDAESVLLRIEKLGNRDLDKEEVASLQPSAKQDGHYRLVGLSPVEPDARLFPPPRKCKLHLVGAKRCLLQRIFF